MHRRQFLLKSAALTAGTVALTHEAAASVVDAFGDKTRPVDTKNVVEGWGTGRTVTAKPLTIKGRTIGGGRPGLIAPTTAKTTDALVATVKDFAKLEALDMVEVRIDYLGKLSPAEMAAATAKAYEAAGDKIVLVTLRNGTDGGPFVADDDYYGKVYDAVLDSGRADVVDIELFRDAAMVKRLVEKAHAKGVKVIISDHEFKFTPDEAEIMRRLMLEDRMGADILKIAVMAHSSEDALTVMMATAKMRHYHTDKPMLTMAMGAAGVLTRITGEGFGSDLTFASVGGKASAPGQIPLEDCRTVLETLHKAMNP